MAQLMSDQSAISRGVRQRERYTPPIVREEIERLVVVERVSAAEVDRILESDPRFKGSKPSLRTIQDIAREVRAKDASAPWSLAADELVPTVDPTLVLPVVAAITEVTD